MWCRPLPPPAIDLILFFFTRPLHSSSTVENVSRYLVRVAVYLRVKLSDVVLNPSTILTTSLHHWVDRFTQQYVRVQKKWNPLNFLVLGGRKCLFIDMNITSYHRTVYDYSPFRIWNWLNSFFLYWSIIVAFFSSVAHSLSERDVDASLLAFIFAMWGSMRANDVIWWKLHSMSNPLRHLSNHVWDIPSLA